MKKLISLLFLFTMLVQAIPVLHFFMEKPEVFYSYIDEEKTPEKEKKNKELKNDDNTFLSFTATSLFSNSIIIRYLHYTTKLPPFPQAELLSPPPNIC